MFSRILNMIDMCLLLPTNICQKITQYGVLCPLPHIIGCFNPVPGPSCNIDFARYLFFLSGSEWNGIKILGSVDVIHALGQVCANNAKNSLGHVLNDPNWAEILIEEMSKACE